MTVVRALPGLFLLAFALILPESAAAQRGGGTPPTPESRARLERRVQEQFDALIRKDLSVDSATATRLRRTVDGFAPERRDLARRQGEVRWTMRHLDSLLPPSEAQAVLDRLVDIQRDELELIMRERAALLEFLTPGQVLRFYALRDQMNERVRAMRGVPGAPRPGPGFGVP